MNDNDSGIIISFGNFEPNADYLSNNNSYSSTNNSNNNYDNSSVNNSNNNSNNNNISNNKYSSSCSKEVSKGDIGSTNEITKTIACVSGSQVVEVAGDLSLVLSDNTSTRGVKSILLYDHRDLKTFPPSPVLSLSPSASNCNNNNDNNNNPVLKPYFYRGLKNSSENVELLSHFHLSGGNPISLLGNGNENGIGQNPNSPNIEVAKDVDFLGSSESIKRLFSLPYTEDDIYLAFHNIGGTLFVDNLGEVFRSMPMPMEVVTATEEVSGDGFCKGQTDRKDDNNCNNSNSNSNSSNSSSIDNISDEDPTAMRRRHISLRDDEGNKFTDHCHNYIINDNTLSPVGLNEQLANSLESQLAERFPLCLFEKDSDRKRFLGQLLNGSNDQINHQKDMLRQIEAQLLSTKPTFQLNPPPSHFVPNTGQSLRQLLTWQFHEMKMLIGSDLRIYGNEDHPALAALYQDVDEQPELVTCIDAYLDNVMASIPELALCMHKRGYIRSCKLVRTEEIPSTTIFEGVPLFDPKTIDFNATMLLRFLKENCSTESNTYLLHRDAGGNSIQLYDLSNLTDQRKKKWKWLLAMLCYRFAVRISQQIPILGRETRRKFRLRQRSLLETCLQLLRELSDMGMGNHASISAAVNEYLADTYLQMIHSPNTSNEECIGKQSENGTKDKGTDTYNKRGRKKQPGSGSESETGLGGKDVKKKGFGKVFKEGDWGEEEDKLDNLGKALKCLDCGIAILCDLLTEHIRELMEGEDDIRDENDNASAEDESNNLVAHETHDILEDESTNSKFDKDVGAVYMVSVQLFGMKQKFVDTALQLLSIYRMERKASSIMELLRCTSRHLREEVLFSRLHGDRIEKSNYHSSEGVDVGLSYQESMDKHLRAKISLVWNFCGDFTHDVASNLDTWCGKGTSYDDVVNLLEEIDSLMFEGLYSTSSTENDNNNNSSNSHNNSNGNDNIDNDNYNSADPMSNKSNNKLPAKGLAKGSNHKPRKPNPGGSGSTLGRKGGSLNSNNDNKLNSEHFFDLRALYRKTFEQGAFKSKFARMQRLLLVACSLCYQRAYQIQKDIDAWNKEHVLVPKKLGDSCNEVGKSILQILIDSQAVIDANNNSCSNKTILDYEGDTYLDAAGRWFQKALEVFVSVNDRSNIALVHCNLGSVAKVAATIVSKKNDSSNRAMPAIVSTDLEWETINSVRDFWYLKAIEHCNQAHSTLEDRSSDPQIWELISTELAMIYLTMGVRRRQSTFGKKIDSVLSKGPKIESQSVEPAHLSLSRAEESFVLEPLEKALHIYEDLGNGRQIAAANYQLGSFYSKIWTGQNHKTKARDKLRMALTHYLKAYEYFRSKDVGPTLVIIILDLCDLYTAVHSGSPTGDSHCLTQALQCLLGASVAFESGQQWYQQSKERMESVEPGVRKRLSQILLRLITHTERNHIPNEDKLKVIESYKDMYRFVLKNQDTDVHTILTHTLETYQRFIIN